MYGACVVIIKRFLHTFLGIALASISGALAVAKLSLRKTRESLSAETRKVLELYAKPLYRNELETDGT